MELIRRKTDYGIRALVRMAREEMGTKFQAEEIAHSEKIPEEFLYKIFQKLTKSGIVKATRGPRGGFSLAKEPKKIKIGGLVEILQEPVAVNRCLLRHKSCSRAPACRLKDEWLKIQKDIDKTLNKMTLAELVSKGGLR